MTLSIIIVNYNVKYFLEHCLYSVAKAISGIEAEVIVVDNHSTDGSMDYLQEKFPGVQFICSSSNSGFAKACNTGLDHASGKYVLYLNPDTIVAEDSFTSCISFFEQHAGCGALGVKMIDGAGNFLKESKRSFPSPLTSLYKLFGLGKLFPGSKVFNRYHLGHLDENEIHEVDVLAGAYLMVRRDVLSEVGSFDERFFMYGEDVDLSFRIQKHGYKNYYYPVTTIIHFKGESTKRGGLNYVRMFYNAMSIFVKKHYGGTRAGIFNFSIHVAIWIRATIAGFSKVINWIGLPMVDAILILLSFLLVKEIWVSYVRTDLVFPDKLLLVSLPVYAAVYVAAAYYAGLYDRYYRTTHLVRSTLMATVSLLVLYALLPESLRFSRGIVVFGALTALLFIAIQRWLMYKAGVLEKAANDIPKPYIMIASTPEEYRETAGFLNEAGIGDKIIGRIAVNGNGNDSVTDLQHLLNTAQALDAKEIIFCAGKLSYKQIISHVQKISGQLTVRFHAFHAGSIIGSDTSDSSGHVLSPETEYNLGKASSRRMKRLLDVISSLLLLLTLPVHMFFVKNRAGLIRNCIQVLQGRSTWVGYALPSTTLPRLRSSILVYSGKRDMTQSVPTGSLQQLDYWYAKNYDPLQDIKTMIRHYQSLGD